MMCKIIILAIAITVIVAEDRNPSTSPCRPGAVFKYYCNSCVCDADGTGAACTKMMCPEGLFNEDGSMRVPESPREKREVFELPSDGTCVPGRHYRNDCNSCQCLEGNIPICTLKACLH